MGITPRHLFTRHNAQEEYIHICTQILFLYLWCFLHSDATLREYDSKEQEKNWLSIMSIKRVILASGSRLLREIIHRAIDKADQLEVVEEIPDWEELPSALETFNPAWVIVAQAYGDPPDNGIDTCLEKNSSVRFIFLPPNQDNVKMKWQTSYEEEYSNLSLKDFIHILEKDLQPT